VAKESPINHKHKNALLINEVQLLLAEKRTYLSSLRTGTAVLTLSLSIIVFLIASREYHNFFEDIRLSSLTIGSLLILGIVGLLVSYRSERKVVKINSIINNIKKNHEHIAKLIV
jgi:uncharacterized membrane protein YidH (DUF202 family)